MNKKILLVLYFFMMMSNYMDDIWGCTKAYKNLHFELCYYQGIEFCLKNNLKKFNPGTQGEHKIQRGFEPVLTYSYHWIKQADFKAPIKKFLSTRASAYANVSTTMSADVTFLKRQINLSN